MSLNYKQNPYKLGVAHAVRSAKAASAAVGLHARFDTLFSQRYHPFTQTLSVEKAARYREKLDLIGYEQVCEAISEGRLPAEIALHLGVPLSVFREWLDDCPADLMDRALRNHAEVSVLKAEMTLSLAPPDKATADVQVALADHFSKRAEKLHPERWGTQRDRANAGIEINFTLPPDIPGLDHLRPTIDAKVVTEPKNPLQLPVTEPFSHYAMSVQQTEPTHEVVIEPEPTPPKRSRKRRDR